MTSAIRHFNERSVPGMGGVWFAMPLIWSLLGIAIAQKPDRRPIEVANAIEALAMKLVLEDWDGGTDPRVRGRRNLPRVGKTFADLRRPGAYVTQPFRQSCAQPLATLGLVEGTTARFNAFGLTPDGERLLEPLADVGSEIATWVEGSPSPDRMVLSKIAPTETLPSSVRSELMRRIYGNGAGAERRKSIRDAGAQLTSDVILGTDPEGLAPDHLIDLRGGIMTVRLREAALQVLGAVENRIAKHRADGRVPQLPLAEAEQDDQIRAKVRDCLAEAERAAPHIETVRDEADSRAFLRECRTAEGLLQRLAQRDGVVIVLRDGVLVPGPAFGADVAVEGDRVAVNPGVPELPRIANLLALTEDLSDDATPAANGRAAE
ncbi:hypothetical protein V5F31_08200 [Xanthobacter sp. V7C-4]|uniref:hypothetical protein n=1 Tax=Xanthobacter autotrophicus (strain ATCC BAA-1158 / Py2) TaxID=78245 RepID=UPI00372CE257